MLEIRFADASALADPARFLAAYAAVPAARREKVDRIRLGEAKRLSLCAGTLLDEALRAYGVADAEMDFAEGEHGKPFLPLRPDVQFSLSHSGTLAMCAVADKPVGCDVQRVSPRSLRLAERFFSPAEQRVIFSLPSDMEQQAMFYRIWTLKESFIKCIGLGLSMPLDSFDLFPDGGAIILRQTHDTERYSFTEPEPGIDGYFAACCVRRP